MQQVARGRAMRFRLLLHSSRSYTFSSPRHLGDARRLVSTINSNKSHAKALYRFFFCYALSLSSPPLPPRVTPFCHSLCVLWACYGCPRVTDKVPILNDNYAYLLIDPATGKTACVDPADPEKVRCSTLGCPVAAGACAQR